MPYSVLYSAQVQEKAILFDPVLPDIGKRTQLIWQVENKKIHSKRHRNYAVPSWGSAIRHPALKTSIALLGCVWISDLSEAPKRPSMVSGIEKVSSAFTWRPLLDGRVHTRSFFHSVISMKV
jgi:hypothetical protein